MEILSFEDLGNTSVISESSLGVNLVIDNFFLCSFRYFTSAYNLKAIGSLLGDLGDTVSFGYERSCSSPRRVSNFNSNVPQGVSTLI